MRDATARRGKPDDGGIVGAVNTAPAGAHDHVGHQHGGTGHAHGVSADADRRRIATVLVLLVAFMAAEVVVGILVSSLALVADSAHMLTDAGALALALVAIHLAARPAQGRYTFGLKRAEILSAQVNGLTLLVLGGLIVFAGIRRLIDPPTPGGVAIVVVACVGIGVNLAATWQLSKANRESLNVEGAFLHILTDLFAFIGTAFAGILIITTGFVRADGIAALCVAASMLWGAFRLLRESGGVFMEAAPRGVDVAAVGDAMAGHAGVRNVHDLHVWEITSGMPSLSAHVIVGRESDCHRIRRELEHVLDERFGIEHTTLQVEHESVEGELIQIGERSPHPPHA